MNKIIFFVICICSISSVSAGLFEYNVIENPSAGVEKQLILPGYSHTQTSTPSYNTNTTLPTNVSTQRGYTQPYQYSSSYRPYFEDIRAQNGFYSYTELKRELEADLRRFERRAEDIDDIKRDLVLDIRRYKSYSNGSRYYDIRRQLEDELDHLEDEERYVEDIIDDLEDEIKDLKRNKSSTAYYFYDGRHYNASNYSPIYSQKSYYSSSFKNYDSGYYYYDKNFGYTYVPSWVNPDLNSGLDRDIYIR